MNDFLARLDSADPASVPSLCLLYADWLSERGEPCEGWRALGMLGKVPRWSDTGRYMWLDGHRPRIYHHYAFLDVRWDTAVGYWETWDTRSLALAAAAQAFEGLADEVKRDILDSVKGVMA